MSVRIFKPAKTAMQSGEARTKEWVLEFEPGAPRSVDPLMGWTSSSDMRAQVRLEFETKDEARARRLMQLVHNPAGRPDPEPARARR